MAKRRVCVFNQTRQSFLSFDTTVADTTFARLRGLLGRRELKSDQGLWLIPCQGIHTIGLLFPIDVIYLDADHRVLHVIEHLQPFRMTSLRRNSYSVLELPLRTVFGSQTEVGDQIQFLSISEREQETDIRLVAAGESQNAPWSQSVKGPAAVEAQPGRAAGSSRHPS